MYVGHLQECFSKQVQTEGSPQKSFSRKIFSLSHMWQLICFSYKTTWPLFETTTFRWLVFCPWMLDCRETSFNEFNISIIANEFRCSECSKLLPTERLLREHVRYHRLVFTCPHCPIDEEGRGRCFPNTHSLGTHISYCHSESRPFPCPETDCSYSAKSQTDLSKHLEVHANTLWYCCEVGFMQLFSIWIVWLCGLDCLNTQPDFYQ